MAVHTVACTESRDVCGHGKGASGTACPWPQVYQLVHAEAEALRMEAHRLVQGIVQALRGGQAHSQPHAEQAPHDPGSPNKGSHRWHAHLQGQHPPLQQQQQQQQSSHAVLQKQQSAARELKVPPQQEQQQQQQQRQWWWKQQAQHSACPQQQQVVQMVSSSASQALLRADMAMTCIPLESLLPGHHLAPPAVPAAPLSSPEHMLVAGHGNTPSLLLHVSMPLGHMHAPAPLLAHLLPACLPIATTSASVTGAAAAAAAASLPLALTPAIPDAGPETVAFASGPALAPGLLSGEASHPEAGVLGQVLYTGLEVQPRADALALQDL